MGDTAGEGSYSLHLLGLLEMGIQDFSLFFRLFAFGDIPENTKDQLFTFEQDQNRIDIGIKYGSVLSFNRDFGGNGVLTS